jgi:ribonuclease E
MNKKILIDGTYPNQYRVALINSNGKLEDVEYESSNITPIKGNIYLAKVVRVEPGLQAAFIDYGGIKNGFLPFSEIHPGYYNIPIADTHRYTSELTNLQEISAPKVNSDEIIDESYSQIDSTEDKELDIAMIEKIIDEDTQNQLDNALDTDDDKIQDEKIEPIPIYKQYKIQEVIKKGQIILVQALKDERGNKGASFSSYISLAGKYCVLMPNNPGHHGISRRISNGEERRRLKDLITKLVTEEDIKIASVIVRTAGMGRPSADIKRDYEYLVRLWNLVREQTLKSRAPSLIHIEEGIIQKTIRDLYDNSVGEIIIEGQEAHQSAIDFMVHLLPQDVKKIKKHNNLVPLFTSQGVESQIASLYQQIVHLPSGGYVVINPTEALTAIDVNSGRSTSERNIEETALKTNVEAAKEIASQIKIRDISGLIVIDFIDMYEGRNRKIVERSLKEFLARDKAKIHIGNISSFGLLEMSRQRLRPSFLESHTKMCTHCNGKGIVRDDEANAMVIMRTIENEIYDFDVDIANIYANSHIVLHMLNHKRIEIETIEHKYGIKLNFLIDHSATADSFSLEKVLLEAEEPEYDNYPIVNDFIQELEQENDKEKYKPSSKKSKSTRRKWKDSSESSRSDTAKADYDYPKDNEPINNESDKPELVKERTKSSRNKNKNNAPKQGNTNPPIKEERNIEDKPMLEQSIHKQSIDGNMAPDQVEVEQFIDETSSEDTKKPKKKNPRRKKSKPKIVAEE